MIGASGFIGRHLTTALRERGDTVTTVSLRDVAAAAAACRGADAVVLRRGLDGADGAGQHAEQVLVTALATLDAMPKAYVTASAIGYYGTSVDATYDETSPPGDDYLAEVCVAWEAEADRAAALGMRVAKIRTGLVLGRDGGALAKLLPIFNVGGGGPVASGRQWYSWIHIADQVGIYLHALDGTGGILDATAPEPVRNAEFTQALASAVHRPALFPVPALALRLLLGEGATIVTRGQRVLPTRTLATGYTFAYPTIDAALGAIARS
ncbi:MAG: TIGR01777 family oxidoreductase [Vulcanimicrobiaceae bacterium]